MQLSEYEITISGGLLGKGGFGIVSVGFIKGRKVAVKSGFGSYEKFEYELMIHQLYIPQLSCLCRAVAYCLQRKYIAYPLLDAPYTTLYDLPVKAVTSVKTLVCNLTYCVRRLHEAKVMHNDLKSDNFMVNADTLECKLIDFGLATCMHHR